MWDPGEWQSHLLIGTYISVIGWKNTIQSTSSKNISIFLNAVFEKPKRPGNFQNNLYVSHKDYFIKICISIHGVGGET